MKKKKRSSELSEEHKELVLHGAEKIKKGMVIYTHNFSSTVLNILLAAKNRVKFEVHISESKPTSGGKKMAAVLVKHKIPVLFYLDSAARQAIKKADIVLLGADTIAEDGTVYSAIGSELIAEIAEKYDVPLYICAPSEKFNPKKAKEYASSKKYGPENEVWPGSPKGVYVLNYKYEKINPRLITGIISELGILKPSNFVEEIKKR